MTTQALRAEADHLDISFLGKKTETVKREITEAWTDAMRTRLADMGIDHAWIDDATMEPFFNYFLALKSDRDESIILDARPNCGWQESS